MQTSFVANLRQLPHAINMSSIVAGLLVMIVGTAASLIIVFQAASSARLSPEQTSSWIVAILIGTGISSIIMSLWFRQPVIAAWSTPGAALLATSLQNYQFEEAIGAYLIAAVVITLLGVSGLFGWVMKRIPQSIALGMLAGVLIKFGFGMFAALPDQPLIVLSMIVTFFVLRGIRFRAPAVGALVVGLAVAALTGSIVTTDIQYEPLVITWTTPDFSSRALLGLALPLIALALTSQNAPGLAVLRAAGYDTPVNGVLIVTGLISLVTAPFGGHGLTLAAITAALVTGPEAHANPERRYAAGFMSGVFYIVLGLLGTTFVSLFTALPSALIATLAALALTGTIITSVSTAVGKPEDAEGGIIALLCTASNFTLLGIGAPFWGLLFGLLTHYLVRLSGRGLHK